MLEIFRGESEGLMYKATIKQCTDGFSSGSRTFLDWGSQPIIGQLLFAGHCMKMKEIGQGALLPIAVPLNPAIRLQEMN